MGALVESVQVAVPLRTAYDQWTQFETLPRIMTAVKDVDQERPAVTRWTVGYGPLRHEYHAETLEQQPDSHVRWRSLDRRLPHEGRVTFHPLGPDRTSVDVEMRLDPPALSSLVILPVARRLVRSELAHFRTFIEGMGEASESWRGTIHDGRVQHAHDDSPRTPGWPHG
jgi:uncharacterized membrane protein